MQTDFTGAINTLAQHLAVPAQMLWATLLRQAYIEGAQRLVFLALLVPAIWLLNKWRLSILAQKSYADDGEWIAFGFASIGAAIALLFAIVNAINGVGYLFNPQYFALQEILDALKH